MRYLVLGGSGFLGSRIVNQLSIRHQVRVADLAAHVDFATNPRVEFVPFDFLKADSFDAILEGVDGVIHLISTLFPEDGTQTLCDDIKSNVFPTIHLLEAMVKQGGMEMLFVSSGGTVYGEGAETPFCEGDESRAHCTYALIKSFIESTLALYVHQHGLKSKVVRVANPYGVSGDANRKQGLIPIFVDHLLENKPIVIWGDGENIRDYIYMDDMVDAIEAVLDYAGPERVFNIGSGSGHSIKEVIERIQKSTGSRYEPLIEYAPARKCDLKRNVLDIHKVVACTGWQPKVGLDEGIARIIKAR